jgi:hypothetical protein
MGCDPRRRTIGSDRHKGLGGRAANPIKKLDHKNDNNKSSPLIIVRGRGGRVRHHVPNGGVLRLALAHGQRAQGASPVAMCEGRARLNVTASG